MSNLVGPNAPQSRIVSHAEKAFVKASGRGGNLAKLAVGRLQPALTTVKSAMATLAAASAAAAITQGELEGEAVRINKAVMTLRNTAWGALSRPQQSSEMDYTFPGGAQVYTKAPPEKKPRVLRLLAARFRSVKSERWTPEMCEGWAKEVDALRASIEAKLAAHEPNDADELLADAANRAATMNVHAQLTAFKRDLRSSGMSTAQVDDIIPDGTPASGRKKPTDSGTTPGSGAPAPDSGSTGPSSSSGSGGGGSGSAAT